MNLIFNIIRLLENKIKEKKTKIRLKIIKAVCHSAPKINLEKAINRIGIV